MNKPEKQSVSALLTLLQDDDIKVASLAMEQFLNLGLAEETIAEFQEDRDPKLRQRIHQLSGILRRRRAREEFLAGVEQERFTLWEGVIQINCLYDPQCRAEQITEFIQTIAAGVSSDAATAAKIAALMREQEFAVPEEDLLDVDLYLVERVLETKYGSPALLCAIAQQAGQEAGWSSTIVLYEGRFCLIDKHNLLLDPAEGWHVFKLTGDLKFHPCSRKDLWLGILSQLFMVALVEGHLRDLYHFGDLMAALNHAATEEALPYPLGKSQPAQRTD